MTIFAANDKRTITFNSGAEMSAWANNGYRAPTQRERAVAYKIIDQDGYVPLRVAQVAGHVIKGGFVSEEALKAMMEHHEMNTHQGRARAAWRAQERRRKMVVVLQWLAVVLSFFAGGWVV
ncbi:MAG: hypothetical protein AAFM92_03050 [Pseudomonadota bacterium]